MKHNEIMELLKYIKGAYPRFDITENTIDVWYDFLSDQSLTKVMKRLQRHISESRFEPTISDLLPTRQEKEKESFEMEIARNRWINNGGDPNEFKYDDGD